MKKACRYKKVAAPPDMGECTMYVSQDIPAGRDPVVIEELKDGTCYVMRMVSALGWCSSPMVRCKTITSAKRWVSRYYV